MSDEWSQWSRRHRRVVDLVVAIVLCVVATFVSTLVDSDSGHTLADSNSAQAVEIGRPVSLAVLGWSALASVTLLWRRRFPRAVLAATTLSGVAIGMLGFQVSIFTAGAAVVAAYSIGMWSPHLRTAMFAPVVSLGALLLTSLLHDFAPVLTGERFTLIAAFLVAGAFADAGRSRRDYLAALHARAELAERTREEEARHRVGEERVRIARELHDIVAHHMALAHAQASTAAYLLQSNPELAREMLDQLAGSTSAALRELKATVGLLREDDSDAPLEPTPGLAQLPRLITSFEATGRTVSLSITGVPRSLSPGVDLTAYRIIQEALTNVTKHAGAAAAKVRLIYSRQLLTISVTNDGPTIVEHGRGEPDPDSQGYGLIGMTERAVSVGGHLSAGSLPDGGFEVTTELPLELPKP